MGRRHGAVPAAWDELTQTNSLGHSNQSLVWVPPGHPRPLSIITQSKADRRANVRLALNGQSV
jgi:hypothetical protein